MDVERYYASMAALTFGVSPSSIGLDRQHPSAQAFHAGEHITLETARRWSQLIGAACERLYILAWGVDIRMERRALMEDAADDGGDDMGEARCVFPSLLPMALVQELFRAKIMTFDAFASYMSHATQLGRNAFQPV